MSEPRKIVLIIGNGFDLDLGLHTSYKDFWESEFCPKHYPAPIIQHLGNYWPNSLDAVKWYDLENELLNYYKRYEEIKRFPDVINKSELSFLQQFNPKVPITNHIHNEFVNQIGSLCHKGLMETNPLNPYFYNIPYLDDLLQGSTWRDHKAFQLIREGLIKYLDNALKGTIHEEAIATSVLFAITKRVESGDSINIYNFNFTPLPYSYGETCKDYLHYVHGTINRGNIIIGTKDYGNYCPEYDFLQKSFDSNFNPPAVVYDLLAADDVIIFGHSLGENDSQYFKAFFKRQSSAESPVKKTITIFTKDTTSEIEIKRSLQKMTDTNLSSLYGLNTVKIFKTDELYHNPIKFIEFLENYINDQRYIGPIVQQLSNHKQNNKL